MRNFSGTTAPPLNGRRVRGRCGIPTTCRARDRTTGTANPAWSVTPIIGEARSRPATGILTVSRGAASTTIMERHRGEARAMLSFSRVSNLPDDLPDWIRAEASVKRHAAAVREAAVLLEAAGVAVDYTYMPEETE